MQKKEKLPVKYLINTSSQELHILGNEFYKEQGATLIGPKSYEKLIKEQQPLTLLERLSNAISTNTRLIPLDVYQNENTTITIGKKKIEIKKLEKGESKNLVVYLPSQETIFVGEYVSNKRIPDLKSHHSLNEWLENLKTIEKLSWNHIITAHGVKRNRKALSSTKNYLTKLKQTVLESLNNPSKNRDNEKFKTYQNVAFFKEFHFQNIQQAYSELKDTQLKIAKVEPEQSKSSEEAAILAAMSGIKTNKILKEGTTKGILVSSKPTIVISEKPKETIKIVKAKTIKTVTKNIKRVRKEKIYRLKETIEIPKEENIETVTDNFEIASVELTQETSIQRLMEEASRTSIAPITQEDVPCISYDKDFYTAQRHAIKEHKMVLIKVEADNCLPCVQLDQLLEDNKRLRKMINKYTTAIKINSSYESVPLGLTNMGTPTVFVINPKTEKVLMKLEGSSAFEDLEDSLKSITGVNDNTALALAQ